MTEPRTGQVVAGYGEESVVESPDGALVRCLTRRRTGRAVCGDQVLWRPSGSGDGVVERILPRRNTLERTDFRGRARPLAANLDQLVVVVAVEPEPDRTLLDRYLVLAASLDVEPLILLNKADQPGVESVYAAALAPYSQLGYRVERVSAKTGAGVEVLEAHLRDRLAVLVGQSGVGKSSLINTLLPERETRTRALSETSGQGRHTTSATTLYPLPAGGALADSPGIRILRLHHLTPGALEQGFVEIAPLAGHCRFADCRHRDEPECAVREAVAAGRIEARRLASFHELLSEGEAVTAGRRDKRP